MNALAALLLTVLAMIDFATPRPLADAIASLSEKTPIGAALRSADWRRVPLALRQRAFFSAAVESARFLQTAQDRLLELVRLQRRKLADGTKGAFLSRARFIAELRGMANELGVDTRRDGDDTDTLADITSDARLGLIFDIQTQQAAEFAKWKMEQDPDVLDAFPAQELIRVEDREVPRDWLKRWSDAGGTLREGRMIALKNDPIWMKLSRFGTPYPPFDFNSGMGLDDIGRDEAERLGLLQPTDRVQPASEDFNATLKASVRGLSTRLRTALKTIFDEQIDIAGDEARWNSNTDHEARRAFDRDLARSVFARSQASLATARSGELRQPESGALQAAIEREWSAQIGAVAAGRKPLFHEQLGVADSARKAAALADSLPSGVEARAIGEHLYVWRPDSLPVSIEEAHRLSLADENGELLGYGARSMNEPGALLVLLRDRAGEIIGGFRSRLAEARQWARRRANDYRIAWDEPITAEVFDR